MNNKRLVKERSRDIGNFLVGRLLPFAQKRQVGPFTFIDHMGPVWIDKNKHMSIDQHPHIGLSTLTYLLEGAIQHKDSTGANQVVSAGDVGFMTSGSGVAHTERTPRELITDIPVLMHGYQIWVALPKELEECAPTFQYLEKKELPTCIQNGLKLTVVAGKGFGMESPLKVHSPLFMVDVYAEKENQLEINGQLEGEIAIVVVKGKVSDGETSVEAGEMLISKTENECCLQIEANTRLLLFGGDAFPEERYLHWNFVSSSKERIEQAKADWDNKKFPKVPSDDTYIPLPVY